MKDNKCRYMWTTTTTTTTTKITLQSFFRPPSLPTWRSSFFLIGLMVKSTTFCIRKKKNKTKQKQNTWTTTKKQTNKQNSYTVGYTALRFLTQVRPHLSRKVTFVKSLPQRLNYLSNETIHVLVMSEACVAILFAYKCLYSFVKALDEIKKKMQTVLMPFVGSLEPLDHPLLRCQ